MSVSRYLGDLLRREMARVSDYQSKETNSPSVVQASIWAPLWFAP